MSEKMNKIKFLSDVDLGDNNITGVEELQANSGVTINGKPVATQEWVEEQISPLLPSDEEGLDLSNYATKSYVEDNYLNLNEGGTVKYDLGIEGVLSVGGFDAEDNISKGAYIVPEYDEENGYSSLEFAGRDNGIDPVLLRNIADPATETDAVNKDYVDSNFWHLKGQYKNELWNVGYLSLADSSDTYGSAIVPYEHVNGKAVLAFEGVLGDEETLLRNIADPEASNDAATRGYVDSEIAKINTGSGTSGAYLPLAGGIMTGEIKLGQGDGKGIQLGQEGFINATVGDTTTATVLGVDTNDSNPRVIFGHSDLDLRMRGKLTRPKYSTSANYSAAKELALLEDVDKALCLDPTGISTSNDSYRANVDLNMGLNSIRHAYSTETEHLKLVPFEAGETEADYGSDGHVSITAKRLDDDSGAASQILLNSNFINGGHGWVRLTGVGLPENDYDAANKLYVDEVVRSAHTHSNRLVKTIAYSLGMEIQDSGTTFIDENSDMNWFNIILSPGGSYGGADGVSYTCTLSKAAILGMQSITVDLGTYGAATGHTGEAVGSLTAKHILMPNTNKDVFSFTATSGSGPLYLRYIAAYN